MGEYKGYEKIYALAQMAIEHDKVFQNDVWELNTKAWNKGGKERIYLDAVRHTLTGRVSKIIKLGYYDLVADRYVPARGGFDVVECCIH